MSLNNLSDEELGVLIRYNLEEIRKAGREPDGPMSFEWWVRVKDRIETCLDRMDRVVAELEKR